MAGRWCRAHLSGERFRVQACNRDFIFERSVAKILATPSSKWLKLLAVTAWHACCYSP